MKWLLGALAVVVAGLLVCQPQRTQENRWLGCQGGIRNWYWVCWAFSFMLVEVTIGSNLGELLQHKDFGGLQASEVTPYIAMYWGSLMIGRWAGAISAFKLSQKTKTP